MYPPPSADASGYSRRNGVPFVSDRRPRPVRKTLWGIGWVLWSVVTIGLFVEWGTHRNNYAGDFVLIVFWSIFSGAVIVAPWFSTRTADGLTQFSSLPVRKRDRNTGELLRRTTRGTLWRPDEVRASYFETHPRPLDWQAVVAVAASRLRAILPTGVEVRAERVSLVLTAGEARRTVHLSSMFAAPPQDEAPRLLRGCMKMLAETQSFLLELGPEPWPLRPGSTGGDVAYPVAQIVGRQIVLWYADSTGPVAVLAPIAWPGDPAAIA
jgi:hypothetical protein